MIIRQVIDIDSETESTITALLDLAYEGDFSPEDWEHTFGGQYFIGYLDGTIIAHGSVVPRKMFIDGEEVTVGYVEAIAVLPTHWRQGFGTQLMAQITEFCLETYELSILSSDAIKFYSRLGWREFVGESFVQDGDVEVRTEEEDEGLMLLHGKNSQIREIHRAVCESRSGDDW
jgi:aminoglycoside 2'-N-acetyltransferase I